MEGRFRSTIGRWFPPVGGASREAATPVKKTNIPTTDSQQPIRHHYRASGRSPTRKAATTNTATGQRVDGGRMGEMATMERTTPATTSPTAQTAAATASATATATAATTIPKTSSRSKSIPATATTAPTGPTPARATAAAEGM